MNHILSLITRNIPFIYMFFSVFSFVYLLIKLQKLHKENRYLLFENEIISNKATIFSYRAPTEKDKGEHNQVWLKNEYEYVYIFNFQNKDWEKYKKVNK